MFGRIDRHPALPPCQTRRGGMVWHQMLELCAGAFRCDEFGLQCSVGASGTRAGSVFRWRYPRKRHLNVRGDTSVEAVREGNEMAEAGHVLRRLSHVTVHPCAGCEIFLKTVPRNLLLRNSRRRWARCCTLWEFTTLRSSLRAAPCSSSQRCVCFGESSFLFCFCGLQAA